MDLHGSWISPRNVCGKEFRIFQNLFEAIIAIAYPDPIHPVEPVWRCSWCWNDFWTLYIDEFSIVNSSLQIEIGWNQVLFGAWRYTCSLPPTICLALGSRLAEISQVGMSMYQCILCWTSLYKSTTFQAGVKYWTPYVFIAGPISWFGLILAQVGRKFDFIDRWVIQITEVTWVMIETKSRQVHPALALVCIAPPTVQTLQWNEWNEWNF